jgi:hypothetical protein
MRLILDFSPRFLLNTINYSLKNYGARCFYNYWKQSNYYA